MSSKSYAQSHGCLKFEENKSNCFSVAGTNRKTLALNYYGSLQLRENFNTIEFFINENLDDYSEVVDLKSSGSINNYADHVLSILSNFQNDERRIWKTHLKDYNIKNLLDPLPCSGNVNCMNSELYSNDFKNIKESIDQYEEVNKDLEPSKSNQIPKRNSFIKNYNSDPENVGSSNFNNISNEDSPKSKVPLFFKTARRELEIQNAKKFGKNNVNEKNCPAPVKKSLGTRKNGVFNKFQPPLRSNEVKENENKMEVDEVVDERLKNIDPAMIELIKNEIMDSGSKITWNDIAGLHLAKTTIQEIVVWPMLRPDIFTGLRRPPKGILLFGPPGTGKTLIGKCIASQSNSTFFSISASSLTSKWVGDGEKMVRTLFAVARVYQPSVVFIDEIDSLLTQRTDSDHECSRRIKTEFLVQLDGAGTDDEDRILIIGATNRPQELDEAARRRLVKRLYIPLPDEEARKQIIQNLISSERHCLTDSDLQSLAKLTEGYSGADVKNLCQEASLGPIRSIAPTMIQSISPVDGENYAWNAFKFYFGSHGNQCVISKCVVNVVPVEFLQVRPLNVEDFKSALRRIKSSVSDRDLDIYLAWDKQYGCGSFS